MKPTGGRCVAALLMLAAVLLPACAAPRAAQLHPVWPPPPAAPRIKHVLSLHSPSDLEHPGLLARLANLVGGHHRRALLRPENISIAADRTAYITDQEHQCVYAINLNTGDSSVIDQAGQEYFVSPVGVAVCGSLIAVSDSSLNQVYLLGRDGTLKTTLKKPGGFRRPTGLAFDPRRKLLFVVDTLSDEVLAFDMDGKLRMRFGRPGTDAGEFNFPTQIFIDRQGRLYVTDSLNHRVQAFDPDGKFLFYVGSLGDASGHLAVPKGVGVDSLGHIYVADSYFSVIEVFDQKGRFLLSFGGPGKENGQFQVPTGVTVDAQNRIYVCDSYNGRVQVFQYIGEKDDENQP